MPDPNPQIVKKGQLLDEPDNRPTTSGATFLFWSENADANPRKVAGVYQDAFDFTAPIEKNTTLYAIWGFKLKFIPRGGEGQENDGSWDENPNNADALEVIVAPGTTLAEVQTNLNQGQNPVVTDGSGQLFAFWSTHTTIQESTPFPSKEPLQKEYIFYAHYGFEVTLRAWSQQDDPDSANGHFPGVVPEGVAPPTSTRAVIRTGQTMAHLPEIFLPDYTNGEGRELMHWTEKPYLEDGATPAIFSDPITKAGEVLYSVWGIPVYFHASQPEKVGGHFTQGDAKTVITDQETGLPITVYTRVVAENSSIGGLGSDNKGQKISWAKDPSGKNRYALRFWSTDKDATMNDRGVNNKEYNFTTRIKGPLTLYPVFVEIKPFEFVMNLETQNTSSALGMGTTTTVSLNIDQQDISSNAHDALKNDFYIDWGAPGTVPVGYLGTYVDPNLGLGNYVYHYTGDPTTGKIKGRVRYIYENSSKEQTISISGEMPGGIKFAWNNDYNPNQADQRLIRINSPLLPMLDDPISLPGQTDHIKTQAGSGLFSGCQQLNSIDEEGDLFANNPHLTTFGSRIGLFDNVTDITFTQKQLSNLLANLPDLTSADYMFWKAIKLTEIPETMFARNKNITTFHQTFYECKALTAIPPGLFANNKLVENFAYTFYKCTVLTAIPPGLFANNKSATDFSQTFRQCTGVKGPVPELWKSHPSATDTSLCFSGMTASQITNWGDIPSNWK